VERLAMRTLARKQNSPFLVNLWNEIQLFRE
jgi:hypothetical protein